MTIFVLTPQSESMKLNKPVTSEQKMQWLIAKSLGTNLDASVQISMKAVSSLIIQMLDLLIVRFTMSG